MIEIIYTNEITKTEPHYLLEYKYTHYKGSPYDDTLRYSYLELNNPHIERYVKLLNSLMTSQYKRHVILNEECITKIFEEGQINEKDYNFLLRLMFADGPSDDKHQEYDDEASFEFEEGILNDEYYFKSVVLYYIDENGQQFKTKFI